MVNYLYHYTSVETLALILKNKTIRFSNLASVDDLEEQGTEDFGDFGRYCFVSCWTKDSEESIPLWNMYTPDMTGVRIRLPEHPFDTEILPANNTVVKEDITYNKGLLALQEKYEVIFMPYQAQLISVTYTEDSTLLKPNIVINSGHNFTLNTGNIGKFKRTSWSFQKEYRYKLHVLPFALKELELMLRQGNHQIIEKLQNYNLSFNYIDLYLKDDFLEEMEILCGPKVSEAQKIIIESLVEKYNPKANIKNSNLLIR
ncbi:DUF2971 domain-containing protein [Schinkia azotoformans]|uniref:DUF2971 domain-containing protein n=1 Tax=Schinkia azotoformans TaxID=1454 RepID=UPI002DBFDC47|nr:DUF2971 domain-containing protein [Schinkia azotoformans]MEC1748061.1 DUF2971 domain-containing protein [Schinkia azotoformans]